VYPLDPVMILDKVDRLELPLIPNRTKSGGAHWDCYFADDAPAALVQSKLRNWAAALGFPDAEIFPKQVRLDGNVPYGNCLNMPYFGKWSLRYAYKPDGTAMTVDEFLDAAEQSRITTTQLRAWPTLAPAARQALKPSTALIAASHRDAPIIDDDFSEYEGAGFENVDEDHLWTGKDPEFWQKMAMNGLGAGERHEGIKFLAGLLFGAIEPTLAEVLVRLFAEHQCEPSFGKSRKEGRELNDIIKWVAKRELAQ
jgi:hypothetical protein